MNNLITELSKLRKSATFLSINGYRNANSEVANYSIVFHMNYENALKKSLQELEEMPADTWLAKQAIAELAKSFEKSLESLKTTPVEEIDDCYHHFKNDDGTYIKGVKVHSATDTLHLYGLVAHKKILMPGIYKEVNSKPLTIEKDRIRHLCTVGKFRQFKITPDQVQSISVEKMNFLPKDY